MTAGAKDWTGLHERLATRALKRQLDDAGLTALARWNDKLSMDDVAGAMTAHFSQLLSRLALSLRDADRRSWEAALAQLAAALRVSEHPPLAKPVDRWARLPDRSSLHPASRHGLPADALLAPGA